MYNYLILSGLYWCDPEKKHIYVYIKTVVIFQVATSSVQQLRVIAPKNCAVPSIPMATLTNTVSTNGRPAMTSVTSTITPPASQSQDMTINYADLHRFMNS